MQLDFVSDDISDYATLDSIVYAMCDVDPGKELPIEPPPLAMLLQAIVSSAPDKMDKRLDDSVAVMKTLNEYSPDPDADESSNLKKYLRWCWQRGSFEKI